MDSTTTQKKPVYCLTETEKAAEIGMSTAFLKKDRMREEPVIPFRKYGRAVRYASEQ